MNFGKLWNKKGWKIVSREDYLKYTEEMLNNEKLAMILKHLVYPKNTTPAN